VRRQELRKARVTKQDDLVEMINCRQRISIVTCANALSAMKMKKRYFAYQLICIRSKAVFLKDILMMCFSGRDSGPGAGVHGAGHGKNMSLIQRN